MHRKANSECHRRTDSRRRTGGLRYDPTAMSPSAQRIDPLIDQLLSLEGLDLIPRTGYLQRGVRSPESVTEHSWHVAVVAWTLLPFVQPIDQAKALELALLHDVGELLIGDLPRPARRLFPPNAKEIAEKQAVVEVLHASSDRATALADDLRHKHSLESRFVHHCDRLQLLLKTATYAQRNEGESAAFLRELGAQPHRPAANDAEQFAIFDELRGALLARHSENAG